MSLASDGQFNLAHAVSPDEITGERETALASAYVRMFGASLEGAYSAERGALVDVRSLKACGRAYYAAAIVETPPAPTSVQLQRLVGPHWLVQLCSGATPEVSVAVSAFATDLDVVRGRITGRILQEFFSVGISSSRQDAMLSPEDAVIMVAQATGARVSEVPELVLPPTPLAPQLARWHVVLDRTTKVRGKQTNAVRGVSDLYVGFTDNWRSLALQHASAAQATMDVYDLPPKGGVPARITLRSLRGRALSLEEVEVIQ